MFLLRKNLLFNVNLHNLTSIKPVGSNFFLPNEYLSLHIIGLLKLKKKCMGVTHTMTLKCFSRVQHNDEFIRQNVWGYELFLYESKI